MTNYYGSASGSASWMGGVRGPSQPSVAASIASIMYKNAVYYTNWRCYRGETPATLNYSCISQVFYAFAHLGRDGGIFYGDEWGDLQAPIDGATGCVGSFINLEQLHPHLQVILSIGGGGNSQNFPIVASSAATRDNFGRSARALVDASRFDGIDIDWEHPSDSKQGRDFLSLLAAVRLYLPDNQYVLTACLPAGRWALQHIDLHRAQNYLDFLNLMAYDFTGPWSRRAGHHAQLYPAKSEELSGSTAVEYVTSTGFPPSKILLGIPLYGRSFLGAEKSGQKFDGHGGEEGTFEYRFLPRPDTDEIVNTAIAAASCSGGDGGFVSYDNPDTVRLKADYCKDRRLGGLFYWSGTTDAQPGPRSLVSTGFKTLHNA